MAMKPILFNTEMVKAILAGLKTQTRRVVKGMPLHEPHFTVDDGIPFACDGDGEWHPAECFCPIQPGDVLWVRETWRHAEGKMHLYEFGEIVATYDGHKGFEYRAGGYYFPDGFTESDDEFHLSEILSGGNWRPSIHMPREAARLFLRVKAVRVDRLQEITSGEAVAEGIQSKLRSPSEAADALIAFEELWNSTIKPADLSHYGWDANPWVWVIEFERVEAML